MSMERTNKAQRRIARQQLVHVLRSQNLRQLATIERMQQYIEALQSHLPADHATAHNAVATYRQAQGQDKTA